MRAAELGRQSRIDRGANAIERARMVRLMRSRRAPIERMVAEGAPISTATAKRWITGTLYLQDNALAPLRAWLDERNA